MFGLTNSKKTLTMSSILLLSVGCVFGSGQRSDSSSSVGSQLSHRSNSYTIMGSYNSSSDSAGMDEITVKGKGWTWGKGFWKMITENKITSILLFAAFAIAMVAMLADFRCIHGEAGKMLFGDNGSSMWLRLAIVVPCLTLSVGAFIVVSTRASCKEEKSSEEYKDWKRDTGRDSMSRILQYIFCSGLLVLAFVVCYFGSEHNFGEAMHLVSWVLPAVIGLIGLGIVIHRNKNLTQNECQKRLDDQENIHNKELSAKDEKLQKITREVKNQTKTIRGLQMDNASVKKEHFRIRLDLEKELQKANDKSGKLEFKNKELNRLNQGLQDCKEKLSCQNIELKAFKEDFNRSHPTFRLYDKNGLGYKSAGCKNN